MTGMMTGIMTGVAAGVNLVSTTVELDCYAQILVYPHTFLRHTVGLVCWYDFYLSTRYYRSLQQKFIQGAIRCCVRQSIPSYTRVIVFLLLIPVISLCLYQSYISVYRIHQRPRGGERLAGRYNAEERLRRRLRPRRCEGRERSVGTSRTGRRSSRCRAAGSGREAASTVIQVSGRRWRGCSGYTIPVLGLAPELHALEVLVGEGGSSSELYALDEFLE